MILSSVKVMTQNDICATRHIQNNTICEIVEVVVLESGEIVEKPENLCHSWIFSAWTSQITCRWECDLDVDELWKENTGVEKRILREKIRIFLWKLWNDTYATRLWKTLRKE